MALVCSRMMLTSCCNLCSLQRISTPFMAGTWPPGRVESPAGTRLGLCRAHCMVLSLCVSEGVVQSGCVLALGICTKAYRAPTLLEGIHA